MRHHRGLNTDERDLIRGLYPSLRRFAAVVGPVDVEPDDLVQEALLRTLRRQPLGELSYPTAYLRRCMVNLAKDHRRSLGRYQGALVRLAAEVGAVSDEYPSDLDELLRLPPRTRAVLYMKEVEGRSFLEIAQVIGCSEMAARSAASRGRRHLRGILSEEVHDATA